MNKFILASRYGSVSEKKQVHQKLAPEEGSIRCTEGRKSAPAISLLAANVNHEHNAFSHENINNFCNSSVRRTYPHLLEELLDLSKLDRPDSQSGWDILNSISKWTSTNKDSLSASFAFEHVSNFVALYNIVMHSERSEVIASGFYLFITHYIDLNVFSKSSIFHKVASRRWRAIFDILVGVASGEPESQGWSEAILDLRSALKQWTDLKNMSLFREVNKLLCLMVSYGFLGENGQYSVTVQNIELFSIKALEKQKLTPCFFTGIIETILYFFEVGCEYFYEGTYTAAKFGTSDASRIAQVYATVTAEAMFQINGDYDPNGITPDQFEIMMEECLTEHELLVLKEKNTMYRNIYVARVRELKVLKTRFANKKKSMKLREAPFGFCINGDSSVGKTSTLTQLVCLMERAVTGEFNPDLMVWVDPNDEYMSNVFSYHKVFCMDDLCNANPKYNQKSPVEMVLRLLNNAPLLATKADVESKGNVHLTPRLVAGTTNIKDLMASTFSLCPESILRRWNLHISMTVKEEYRKPNGVELDPLKLPADTCVFDAWEFEICKVRIYKAPCGTRCNWQWESVEKFDNFAEFSTFVVEAGLDHLGRQKKIVVNNQQLRTEPICAHRTFKSLCPTCRLLCPVMESENNDDDVSKLTDVGQSDLTEVAGSEDTNGSSESVPSVEMASEPNSELVQNGDETHVSGTTVISQVPPNVAVCIREDENLPYVTARDQEHFYYMLDHLDDVFPPEDYSGPTNYGGFRHTDCCGGNPYIMEKTSDENGFKIYIDLRTEMIRLPDPEGMMPPTSQGWAKDFDKTLGWIVEARTDVVSLYEYFHSGWWTGAFMFGLKVPDTFSFLSMLPILSEKLYVIAVCGFVFYISAFVYVYDRFDDDFVQGFALGALAFMMCCLFAFKFIYTLIQNRMSVRARAIPELISRAERVRRDAFQAFIGGSTAFVCLASFYKLHKVCMSQGGMFSQKRTREEMISEVVDKEANVWKIQEDLTPKVESTVVGSTAIQLQNLVSSKVFVCRVEHMFGSMRFHALPIKSNVWAIPGHNYLDLKKVSRAVLTREHNGQKVTINTKIQKKYGVHIPGKDLALLWLPDAGSQKDLLRWFPDKSRVVKTGVLTVVDEGFKKEIVCKDFSNPNTVRASQAEFVGRKYIPDEETKKGYCGAPIVCYQPDPHIVGFHSAGLSGCGFVSSILREDLVSALDRLQSIDGVLFALSESKFETKRLGVDFGPLRERHEESTTKFLEEDSSYVYYGRHNKGGRTFRSEVRTLSMSGTVTKVINVPRLHGPPPYLNSWVHWRRDLNIMAHPTGLICPEKLDGALLNFEERIYKAILGEHKKEIFILNREQNVNGIDGMFMIDALKMKTSCGWPINKPKTHFLTSDLEALPRVLSDEVWDLAQSYEDAMLRGERANMIFRANLKDEPTKLTKEKARIFAGSEIAMTLLVRKYFLSMARFMSARPYLFECAVGINAYSPIEWTRLGQFVFAHGEDRVIAGDYSSWDKTLPPSLTIRAMRIMLNLASWAGYDERSLKVMEGLVTELCYPIYEFNGEIIGILGSNPSGHPMTVYFNNLCNSLLLRAAFAIICPNDDFNECVNVMCYGDDNIMSVKRGIDFTHTAIAEALAPWGIKYTMADKTSKSVPFIHLEQANFLKRDFREQDGYLFAPLDENSLFKQLHTHLKGELSDKEACGEAIKNVLNEYFLYGREVFEQRSQQFLEIIEIEKLQGYVGRLPSYEEVYESYVERGWLESQVDGVNADSQGYLFSDLIMNNNTGSSKPDGNESGQTSERDGLAVVAMRSDPGQQAEPVVGFAGDEEVMEAEITTPYNSSLKYGGESDADLGKFMMRPERIATFTWDVGSNLYQEFDPWTLFYTKPSVAQKIANFGLLRSKLHLKFLMNGNPFYYGRLLASYSVFPNGDEVTQYRSGNFLDLIAQSQRLGGIMDPKQSTTLDLVLPFFIKENWIQIPGNNFDNIGRLVLRSFQPLKHANGGLDAITITVMAYAEDFEMTMPTSQGMDEYSGIISFPASAVARAANALSAIPQIRPFARATEMVASGFGRAAALFGFCRPISLQPPQIYRPQGFGHLACTDMIENVHKLTVDSKQELTIDPRVVGLPPVDELSFEYIRNKESYLTQFVWPISASPDDLLFSMYTHPLMYDTANGEIHMTPIAFMTLPFNEWTGRLKVKLQVVASAYHRGRLRLVYDPVAYIAGGDFNTNYTKIVDLSQDHEYEWELPWGQETTFLRNPGFAGVPFGTSALPESDIFSNGTLSVYVVNELTSPTNDVNNDVTINVFVSMPTLEVANPSLDVHETLSVFPEVPVSQSLLMDTLDVSVPQQGLPAESYHVFFGEAISSFRTLLKRYAYVYSFDVTSPFDEQLTIIQTSNSNFPPYRGNDPNGMLENGGVQYNPCRNTLLNYVTSAFAAWRGGLRNKYIFMGFGENRGYILAKRQAVGTPFAQNFIALPAANIGVNTAMDLIGSTASGATLSPNSLLNTVELETPYMTFERFDFVRNVNENVATTGPTGHFVHVLAEGETAVNGQAMVQRYVATGEDFTVFYWMGPPVFYQYNI